MTVAIGLRLITSITLLELKMTIQEMTMGDWNVGDRVIDLPLWLVYEQKYVGTVRKVSGRHVYVEWDTDPGYVDLMYSDELKEYNGP